MPRVTKRQKEEGKAKGKPAAGGKGAAGGFKAGRGGKPGAGGARDGKPGGGRKPGGGFKVGPSHAPRDAYLGKARKIKAELIQRAKLKKQYAKVLAAEGMSSQRLGRKPAAAKDSDDESDDEGEASRRRDRSPSSSPLPDVDGRRDRSPSSSPLPGDDNDDSDASDDEGAAFAAAMRAELRGERRPDTKDAKDVKRDGTFSKDKKGTKSFKERSFGNDNSFEKRPGSKPDLRKGSKIARERKVSKPAPRALSPEAPAQKSATTAAALRVKKKEAFAKHHHAGKARGQPNMAARMDVLLEKIRMSK